jgi:hypothetical protein
MEGSGASPPSSTQTPSIADSAFARLVGELSEPSGYFDTDNLISNESSYLHVMGALRERGVRGGAYLGVGPDQNFSYIAAVRPEVAFIVDIRRDNLLLHLLFKALFETANTRVEYLSLLHGRVPPADAGAWEGREVDEVVGYVDGAAVLDAAGLERLGMGLDSLAAGFGVPLSEQDWAKLRRFHGEFVAEGLSLRFKSFGRAPQPYYPTYRDLLLERDLDGERSGHLSSEEAYRFLRDMQRENRIVPVVGDFAGEHALSAIGGWLRENGLEVTAFYTSNVEFYLFGDGIFPRFAGNVAALPTRSDGVLIRSYFPSFRGRHPHAVAGYHATQSLQTLGSFVRAAEGGGYPGYWELVTNDALDPRPAGVP